MNWRIFQWNYKGQTLFTIFERGWKRQWYPRHGRFFWAPRIHSEILGDYTAEEIGQLLGGN